MLNQTNNHPEASMFHAYLDDELPHSTKKEFEDHVTHCQECTITITELKDLFIQIEGLPLFELSTDLSHDIVSILNTQNQIEPLLKRTTWVQIGITIIMFVIMFSLFPSNLIHDNLSDAAKMVFSGFEMVMTSLNEITDAIILPLLNIRSLEFYFLDFPISDYLPTNILLTLSVCSGLLWLIGNRILLPYHPPTNSQNGG
jgi:hypothetical protein